MNEFQFDTIIAALELKSDTLREKLKSLQQELRKVKLQRIELVEGVTVSTIVVGDDGKEYKVTKIDVRWGTRKPWLIGNPRKKNGKFGASNRHLYSDWEKKEDCQNDES